MRAGVAKLRVRTWASRVRVSTCVSARLFASCLLVFAWSVTEFFALFVWASLFFAVTYMDVKALPFFFLPTVQLILRTHREMHT